MAEKKNKKNKTMAESTESIVIDVELNADDLVAQTAAAVKQLADLKKEQAELNKIIKEKGTLDDAQKKRYVEVAQGVKDLSAQVKSNTKLIEQWGREQKDAEGSVNAMRKQLKDLQTQYAALSEEERKGKAGKQIAKQAKELSDTIKDADQAVGNYKTTIGRYEEALNSAGVGIDGFKKKMTALLANPWVAIFTAIAAVVHKVVDAFRSSEDRMRELQTAFAPLQGALDVVQQGFDAFAKVLSNVVVGALSGVSKAIAYVAKGLDAIGKAVGKDWGLEKRLQEAQSVTAAITKSEQELADKRREFAETEAKRNNKISELRAQAAEKDKYTTAERIKFIEEAVKLEKANAADRVAIAKQELKLAEDNTKNTENDAAANDALTQARVNLINVTTQYNNTVRELNGQLAEMRNQQAAATATTQAATEATAADTVTLEDILKKRKELRQQYGLITDEEQQAEELRLLEELYKSEEYNKDNQLLTEEEYQAARAAIIQRYEDERKRAADERQEEEDERRQQDLDAEKEAFDKKMSNIQQLGDAFGQLSSSLQGLSDMYAEDAKSSEAAAKKQKAFAVGSIIASQAQSIANGAVAVSTGIASASAVPFPANIAAIISVVATIAGVVASVASSIKQAKQVINGDAGNYAYGGEVPGRSYSGDKLTAHVNSGEYILPKATTDNLIDTINSGRLGVGIDYDAMAQAMAQAVAAQPAPVMVYREYEQFAADTQRSRNVAIV